MRRLIKRFLKQLFSFKSFFIKCGKGGFIHPSVKIKGYKKIIMASTSAIRRNVWVEINNGLFIMKDGSYVNPGTRIYVDNATLTVGKNSLLNMDCNVIALGNIHIGDNVLIAHRCNIISGDHNYKRRDIPIRLQGHSVKDICINDDVWIGCQSIILGGVTIGKGAIIGAGSVVTKNVGENEIWAGNPAKFIKRRW